MATTIRLAFVDDDVFTLKFIAQRLFSSSAFELSFFPRGKDFLEFYSLTEHTPPDVVFLDINMPDMNGFEVFENAMANERLSRTIFAALSNYLRIDDQRWLGYFGFDIVFEKRDLDPPTTPRDAAFLAEEIEKHTKDMVARGAATTSANAVAKQMVDMIYGPSKNPITPERIVDLVKRKEEIISRRYRNFIGALKELSNLRLRTTKLENDYIKKLISPEVFTKLDTNAEVLHPKMRAVAVGFTDIRGFTQLMNRLQIHQVNHMLELFFDHAIACVRRQKGFLEKFIGDSVMWFHEAESIEQCGKHCISAAVEMATGMPDLVRTIQSKLHLKLQVRAGFGLACGHAAVGIFGSPNHRIQYSVLGPPVNLAARLCAEAPGNTVLLGGEAIDYCQMRTRRIGYRTIRGFDHKIEVHKIIIPRTGG